MRNEVGISIILTDNDAETKRLLEVVQAEEAFPLGMLPQLCLSNPDAVYYETLTNPDQLRYLAKCFSIRRGVLSIAGKREFLGFNVKWMAEVMMIRDLDEAIKAGVPNRDCVNQSTDPKTPTPVFTAPEDDEREDPYEALGYRRR